MNIPEIEKKILEFWKKEKILEKSLSKKSPNGDFVFYDGPITVNARPGIHHVLSRIFKDIIPRFKTMQGFHVERKNGWDTHGLPVELEVEKKLDFKSKKDIEKHGIAKFNQACRQNVRDYIPLFKDFTEKIGYWVDMDNSYITCENDYIETLWWIIKQIHKKGLLYKGHKVIPQCPRCGTALSSHEVAQGYQSIEEESVYIKFKLKEKDNEYILAWTTTPWTLPGNIALAIGKDVAYVKAKQNNQLYYIAKNLLDRLDGKYEIVEEMKGKNLIGLEYEPLFPGVIKGNEKNAKNAFKVYPADFVSTEDGTGVVHTAVMYGVEDYELGEKIGLPKVHSVNLDGTFNELVPQWKGRFVKDVDDEIIKDLKKRNRLYKTEKYAHDYPFCWRCDSPLLYYAKDSWFFKMSELKNKLLENNSKINWVPKHIKEGRFGEWLRDVKDWAISRERYWGTPIPVWICEECEEIKVVGSRKELGVDKNFDLHRPHIDEIKLKCKCGGSMNRIPEVMDCWFDSGAMPFAQYHYPFENKELIDKGHQYPADYIAEAIDQTRGWFYTLLAVSTLLDKGACYKNVLCLGHVLDKRGQKMSKHLGNIIDPWEMIEKYGSDTIRWYLYTINKPGEPKRFDEQGLKESSRIFITLLNVVNFYKIFANDKIEDLKKEKLVHVLDKWINSKLNLLIKNTTERLNKYDITTAGRKIEEFINDLSVWYVRRSREKFKSGDEKAVKSLRHVIFNTIRLLAPFTPFITEYIYQEMNGPDTKEESVHLRSWPEVNEKLIDKELEEKMEKAREICSLALQKRAEAGIKIRQPLQQLTINHKQLTKEFLELIKNEINVKEIVFGKTIELDTKITPELKEEGEVREFIRQVQAIRKKQELTPKDKINVYYSENKKVIEKNKQQIKKQVIADDIIFDKEFKIEKI